MPVRCTVWNTVIDCDCYAGDCSSIPAHSDSHVGKYMNLCTGQPVSCEGNWVVSPRSDDRKLNVKIMSLVAPNGNNYSTCAVVVWASLR